MAKNARKILALLLTLVMVSMIAIPAFAQSEENTLNIVSEQSNVLDNYIDSELLDEPSDDEEGYVKDDEDNVIDEELLDTAPIETETFVEQDDLMSEEFSDEDYLIFDIPDEDIPISAVPVIDVPDEVHSEEPPVEIEEEEIPLETPEEEEVPLAETPQTGDNTVIWFALIALLVIVKAALIADKKCKS